MSHDCSDPRMPARPSCGWTWAALISLVTLWSFVGWVAWIAAISWTAPMVAAR